MVTSEKRKEINWGEDLDSYTLFELLTRIYLFITYASSFQNDKNKH